MKRYIDIHSHLLPGIDDGAKDIEISMEMFRIAFANGIQEMILTPHYKPMGHNASPNKIKGLIEQLEQKLLEQEIRIQLYAGNEILYHSDVVSALEGKKACTLAGSSYVLLEFNPMDDYDYIRNGIYQIMSEGYKPILAHVERYSRICEKSERVAELWKMGCYIQVNSGSIMGRDGLGTQLLVRRLLKQRLIHFVSTDAHNTEKRSPDMEKCAEYLKKKFDKKYAEQLLYENAMHVIKNEYL